MEDQNRPAWMDDPLVKDIPEKKLEFLKQVFAESQGKSRQALMASLLPLMNRARQEKLSFTPQEMGAAVAAIRSHSSEEEQKQIDNILRKAKEIPR